MINNFEILQVSDDKDLFYVVIQDDYDADFERTIISTGKTENKILPALKKCHSTMESIGEILMDKGFHLSERHYLDSEYIEKTCDFGDHVAHRYSALGYDKETGEWGRYYR
jgi:hypothetical protein